MGSMNMPGISLTLLNLTNVSEECSIPVPKLLELLDAPHNSPAWPTTHGIYPLPENLERRKREDAWVEVAKEEKPPKKESKQILGKLSLYFLLSHGRGIVKCEESGMRLMWCSGQDQDSRSYESGFRRCH